ncbi:MAG: GIY-YIG nuclease family protein [Clostridia bacterium]|nr:GIY-YIG nuclease family protein [Clostridia bacterium]
MYIYKITNIINGKVYVGQTNNLEKRTYKHFYLAQNGCKRHLYNAMRYYGLENFEISIIEECSSDEASDREQYWIKEYKSTNKKYGYNKTDGGEMSNSWEHNDHKERTRRLLSEKLKGHAVNQEAIQRCADRRRGVPLTDECKKKISETLKQKYRSGELIPNPPPHYDVTGLRHSEETKKKLSDYRAGKSYEEIYGDEVAKSLKAHRSECWKGENNPRRKCVSTEEIILLVKMGKSNKEIADELNITTTTVWNRLKERNFLASEIRRKENENLF